MTEKIQTTELTLIIADMQTLSLSILTSEH
jgi:hypothetical protein